MNRHCDPLSVISPKSSGFSRIGFALKFVYIHKENEDSQQKSRVRLGLYISFLKSGPGKSVSVVWSYIFALITREFVTGPGLAPHHLCVGQLGWVGGGRRGYLACV